MPRNELRTSGVLQAALIAAILAFAKRGTTMDVEPATWPFVLAAYGALAALLPWAIGGIGRGEIRPAYSLVLGGVLLPPLALCAWWLHATPYRAIALGAVGLAAAWGVHLLVSVIVTVATKGRP
jgi:hypothetical protein